jgi:hypothetical protein
MPRKKRDNSELDPKPVQFTVLLPPELHARLKAEAGMRGIGEEVRQRLEASFDPGTSPRAADPNLSRLFDAISFLARNMSADGKWVAPRSAYVFSVFKVGVNELLSRMRPPGDANPEKAAETDPGYWAVATSNPDDRPETVGRAMANIAWNETDPRRIKP